MKSVTETIESMNRNIRIGTSGKFWRFYDATFPDISEDSFSLGRSLEPFIPEGSLKFNWSEQ